MPSELPSLRTCAAEDPAVLRTHLLTLQALERPLARLDIWPPMSPDVRAPAWRASLLSGKSGATAGSLMSRPDPSREAQEVRTARAGGEARGAGRPSVRERPVFAIRSLWGGEVTSQVWRTGRGDTRAWR